MTDDEGRPLIGRSAQHSRYGRASASVIGGVVWPLVTTLDPLSCLRCDHNAVGVCIAKPDRNPLLVPDALHVGLARGCREHEPLAPGYPEVLTKRLNPHAKQLQTRSSP